jgi:hypothetical protein
MRGTRVSHIAVDARYPGGQFTVYEYASADLKPLNLFDFASARELPHGAGLREAKIEWKIGAMVGLMIGGLLIARGAPMPVPFT